MNIFFTSDLHFGDDRFDINFRNFSSIEEYDDIIIENWNNLIKNSDTIYVLGDVLYEDYPCAILNELNGKKYLIKGNHDKKDDEEYLAYFQNIFDSLTIKVNDCEYYLNHYPTRGCADMWNLCGHVHGNWRCQKNMINVSVDCWGYTPVSLQQINQLKDAIINRYDEDVWAAYHPINTEYIDRGKEGTYWGKLKNEETTNNNK